MSICTLCNAQIPDAPPEEWVAPDGQAVHVVRTAVPSVVIETSVGEFEICEACYQRSLPPFFTPQDLAEIHYQFGLEYRDRGQFTRSVESLTHARGLSETADIVAALAHAESELGHREIAIGHYRRALEIDPSHFMSRQNLQRLYDTAA
jgi:tetratricopeptide (TPR) repeat protein